MRKLTLVMVPDLKIQLAASAPGLGLAPGENVTRLAELKHTCRRKHYKQGVWQQHFNRGVERWAAELTGEYQKKANTMDWTGSWEMRRAMAG